MKLAILMWIANLFWISSLANFDPTRVGSLNWDIVLMLTPWGLIENLILYRHTYLLSAYKQTPPATGIDATLILAVSLQLILALFLLRRAQRR